MDGVVADFASAFHAVEHRLFGAVPEMAAGQPEQLSETAPPSTAGSNPPGPPTPAKLDPREARRRRDAIWQDIRATPDFWTTLEPLQPGAVARLHALALQHRWEIFFITRRPPTEGETVQRQTQRWLARHGFDLPSVLVIAGSRGAAAAALRLDYHVDDDLQNCLDVKHEAGAKVVYVTADRPRAIARLHGMGVGTAASFSGCLDALEEATVARTNPALLARLARLVGWR
jgi:hypothetical protein